MQRIGVFVCHCGSNIAATVDVEEVVYDPMLRQSCVKEILCDYAAC